MSVLGIILDSRENLLEAVLLPLVETRADVVSLSRLGIAVVVVFLLDKRVSLTEAPVKAWSW